MGLLVDGVWQDKWYDTKKSDGKFERWDSVFRNWITTDGAPGPTGEGGFKAEKDRYHLYVSYACPWAHRTLIYRTLKGLEDSVSVSFVHWMMGSNGWSFEKDEDGIVDDDLFSNAFLYEIYLKAQPNYSGRVTVPVLWDKKTETIVSNESSEIIRMFDDAFDDVGAKSGDHYPEDKRAEIDELNERIYHTFNNGVYKCGFATTQQAYDAAIVPLFETMDYLESVLSKSRFLNGAEPSEADWRLFPTLFRFDGVYHGHFKCNRNRLVDYPNLWAYTRDLYQWPGIADTTNYDHAVLHYHKSHETVNPHRILPIGPVIDFNEPHGRG
ncbi:MAG: glutathione S-transferase family protein [Pseudomonadota bacterium]